MGLDQYLDLDVYVPGWEHYPAHERQAYTDVLRTLGFPAEVCPESPSLTVQINVGYWRKANQIHGWFVREVQEGRDECQRSEMTWDKLFELREVCRRVLNSTELVDAEVVSHWTYEGGVKTSHLVPGKLLKNPSLAAELLPPAKGFFFGGDDFDECYWEDLVRTVEIIDCAKELDDHQRALGRRAYPHYRASW
jgi:hypothetical protein